MQISMVMTDYKLIKNMIKSRTMLALILVIFTYIGLKAQTTIVITTSDSGFTNQSWRSCGSENTFDEETVKKYWNEDKYITSVGWTSRGWFYAMNKGVKWTNQSYKIASDWPDDYVHEYKEKGYMITSLSSNDTYFLVVVSKNTEFTDQQVCSAPWTSLKDWIEQWWNKDYYITSIACKRGLWTVVMSKCLQYTDQSYMWSDSADGISNKIQKYWEKGYVITALEYGEGTFLCIMSKTSTSSSAGQSRFINSTSDPESFIDEAWSKGWKITYIGG